MSHITINSKNFARFSKRMKILLNNITNGQVFLGKLQSQEIFSKILGSENLHELRENFNKIEDTTFKLHEVDVLNFFSKNLSTENETIFIKKLNKRVDYIIKKICEICGFDFESWNYGFIKNNDSPSILNCIVLTHFPINDLFKEEMRKNISYSLEYMNRKIISYDKYINDFPTSWLFKSFEKDLIIEVEKFSLIERQKENIGKQLTKRSLK